MKHPTPRCGDCHATLGVPGQPDYRADYDRHKALGCPAMREKRPQERVQPPPAIATTGDPDWDALW